MLRRLKAIFVFNNIIIHTCKYSFDDAKFIFRQYYLHFVEIKTELRFTLDYYWHHVDNEGAKTRKNNTILKI